ncbi:hypothetical protein M1590_03830 [Candidatus Marsarchaeota archaeon]|nr:hypothetical protein [Candidatus Marsarchaeota archaeon]
MRQIIRVYDDGRVIASCNDAAGNATTFLSERIKHGVLITEFNADLEVSNQLVVRGNDAVKELSLYSGIESLSFEKAGRYQGIRIEAKCAKCSSLGLLRELDMKNPAEIDKVPVVPIFMCNSCGNRYYSLTDMYLERLKKDNIGLFEKEELDEIGTDAEKSITTLQEYVIRIFASKRIYRIKLR